MSETSGKIRELFRFRTEWTWRLYLVLQIIGVVRLVYVQTSSNPWQILPYYESRYRGGLFCGLFDSYCWRNDPFNGSAVLAIVGPFLVAKAIDWILEAKNK
jgi:hypothetical protein